MQRYEEIRGRRPGAGGAPGGNRSPQPDQPRFTDDDVEAVLSGDGEKIVERARRIAEGMRRLASSQLRNFYGPLVALRESGQDLKEQVSRLHLMRARLHYMVARESGRSARPLYEAFDKLVPKIGNDHQRLNALYDFVEAVVAYHRES